MIRYIMSLIIAVGTLKYTSSQVLGPDLSVAKAEIGFFHASFQRNYDRDIPRNISAKCGTIYLEQKLHRTVILTLESMITNYASGFPSRDYRTFTIGAGMSYQIFSYNSYLFAFSVNYKEWLNFDRSQERYQKNHRNLTIVAQVERKLELYNQSFSLWGGPAYISDLIKQYPGIPLRSVY